MNTQNQPPKINAMKTIFTFLFILISGSALFCQPVKENGLLRVEGLKLVNEKGNPVILRGMSLGWHNWWSMYYTPETVQWLSSDWKCSVVRAAMGIEPGNGYKEKPEWSTQMVTQVVDAAIQEGIYVIIDWHSHNINLEEAKNFFTKMATLYGSSPNVIYEIFNEPDKESWAEVKAYSEEIIRVIRAIDPDNIILVGSPHWDQDIHLVADDPLKGFTNIMYTVHFYAATHGRFLRDRCNYALGKGIPIFVSESAGMEASGDGPINYAEWNAWIDWMEGNSISWVCWSVSSKKESCSVLLPGVEKKGNWLSGDLNESGIKTRELIRKYNAGR